MYIPDDRRGIVVSLQDRVVRTMDGYWREGGGGCVAWIGAIRFHEYRQSK